MHQRHSSSYSIIIYRMLILPLLNILFVVYVLPISAVSKHIFKSCKLVVIPSIPHVECPYILHSGISVHLLPWQMNNTLIIFLYLHLSLVFLLKRLIFQGFPTFEFSFLFKVSSQIFSYFLMFFPAILVNPLVKQASLPTGFFNYSLSDILLPLHHQNSHGCKCSRLH